MTLKTKTPLEFKPVMVWISMAFLFGGSAGICLTAIATEGQSRAAERRSRCKATAR